MMPKAHFATVYAKPKGRPLVDTFVTEVSQDTWIYFPWDMGFTYQKPIADDHAADGRDSAGAAVESSCKNRHMRARRGPKIAAECRDFAVRLVALYQIFHFSSHN